MSRIKHLLQLPAQESENGASKPLLVPFGPVSEGLGLIASLAILCPSTEHYPKGPSYITLPWGLVELPVLLIDTEKDKMIEWRISSVRCLNSVPTVLKC